MAVDVAVMALVLVVPVDHVDAAVGAVPEADDLRPAVVGQQEIGGVRGRRSPSPSGRAMSRLSRAPWMLFMKIEPRYSLGPGAALVDHGAGVGVAAAGAVGAAVAAVRVGAEVVAVVGDRLDVVVGVRVEVRPGLALVAAALDDVVEVRDDAGGQERLALGVEVDAPGVARAVGEDLERGAGSDDSARCRR